MTNDKYTRLVKLQKAFFNEHITREIPFRLCALDRLAEALVSREKQLGEALHADLGKSAFESYATEIGFLLHEIRTTKNHLQSWARDRHRPTPLFLFGSKSRIHYEPYGCALIIAPWNYPLQLALSPLIGAIAASNHRAKHPVRQPLCKNLSTNVSRKNTSPLPMPIGKPPSYSCKNGSITSSTQEVSNTGVTSCKPHLATSPPSHSNWEEKVPVSSMTMPI